MIPRDPIKVYDARWEAGEFSDDEIRRLFEAACAYGRLLAVDTITLCRDARLEAGHVLELGTETALRMGFRVYLRPEPISTPQSYFTAHFVARSHPGTMGMTVTASHNPPQYVGVKFTAPVVRAVGLDCGPLGGLTRIREIYHGPEKFERVPGGELHLLDLGREYVQDSMALAGVRPGDLEGLSVVLDAMNGAAGPELFTALERSGARVEHLRLIPDGGFPTGMPNPTSRGKMDRAIELAREKSCLAVVGLDGDGDRVVFGGQRGLLTAGAAFVPVLRSCDVPQPPAEPVPVLHDAKVSPVALAEWQRSNTRPILFRNGHSHIKDYMGRVGAVAAAEESGHYYHRLSAGGLTIYCENSILTVLAFLREMHTDPEAMTRLWRLEEDAFTTGEFNYQFPDDDTRDRALAALVDHFQAGGAEAITSTPDGVALDGTCLRQGIRLGSDALDLEDGWLSGCLRISANEKSVVRSYFSAGDASTATKAEAETRGILEERFGGRAVD